MLFYGKIHLLMLCFFISYSILMYNNEHSFGTVARHMVIFVIKCINGQFSISLCVFIAGIRWIFFCSILYASISSSVIMLFGAFQ